jgi:3-hydroxyisobutyrate dehydrogenase-like beta-hydroxyacid dehydrogenase
MNIAFAGLGRMGAPMAANLLDKGHRLIVWNRSPQKAAPLVAAGATAAACPRDAAQAELVITMLADDAAVEDVVFGTDGLLQGHFTAHMSMSTISVDLADRLGEAHREQGQTYVSAPVFGRPEAAAAAKLFVVAAGDPRSVDFCRPAIEAMAQAQFIVGEKPSMANLVKLCGNFMILAAIEAMAEAMTLARKAGSTRPFCSKCLPARCFPHPSIAHMGRYWSTVAIGPPALRRRLV